MSLVRKIKDDQQFNVVTNGRIYFAIPHRADSREGSCAIDRTSLNARCFSFAGWRCAYPPYIEKLVRNTDKCNAIRRRRAK